MASKRVQIELAKLNLYHGAIDGIWGPLSIEALKKFQRLHPPMQVNGLVTPSVLSKLFPKPIKDRIKNDEEYINSIYGLPGRNIVDFKIPYKMKLAWDEEIIIETFQCNAKIVPNLDAIFNCVKLAYDSNSIKDLGLDLFGGCFNIRNKRGGSSLSTHSWGIAVDIDPANNQLAWNKNKARLAKKEYNNFWSIVETNGGYSLGRLKNYDWMHFQFIEV